MLPILSSCRNAAKTSHVFTIPKFPLDNMRQDNMVLNTETQSAMVARI